MAAFNLLAQAQKRTIVCDGGMGTELMARGMQAGACSEAWNVDRPADVRAIHQAYHDAGCDLLTTNTFGGTGICLDKHGHSDKVGILNIAGAKLAREAAGQGAVLGDVGPFGGFLEPIGDTTPEQLADIFTDQLQTLRKGGADAVIIETMSDPNEVAIAVRAAKSVADWPVIATYAFAHGEAGTFRTMMGTSVEEAMKAAIDAGADIVGANCGTSLSLDDYVELAKQLVKAAGQTPVIVQPNAGSPQTVDGKLKYFATPDEMAGLAKRLVACGVRVVGGCCGTTPAHLRAIAKAIRA